MAEKQDHPEMRASVEQFAAFSGATRQEIAALVRSGKIARSPDGKLSVVAAVSAYLESIRDTVRAASITDAADAARQARAEATELALAIDQRALVPTAEVNEAILEASAAVVATFASIPPQVTRSVAEMKLIAEAVRDAQIMARDACDEGVMLLGIEPLQPKRRGKRK
jgi:hypothetical protein